MMPDYWIMQGDCRALMNSGEADSVDAVVTDPPYELNFMGRAWDRSGVAFDPATWEAVYRVLKPGGYLLAFGATRTFHRMTVAIEDAGFDIRDCLSWLYSSGFPKSHNISKAIDKAAGAEREIVGVRTGAQAQSTGRYGAWGNDDGTGRSEFNITVPATPEAQQWEGWGTALKPAWEPVIMARKPLSESTVAANVLQHGTGAVNITATMIGERWPANVAFDAAAAESLTGADRYFFCSKASTSEKNAGLTEPNTHTTVKPIALMRWLVRMITPPDGLVLDPFCGSGSTGCAAVLEGFDFVGMELQPENVAIIEQRIAHYAAQVTT